MTKYLLLLITILLAGCGKPKQQLNVFIWPDYIDPKIVADFEDKFGCKVVLDFYEDNESMIAKLAAGGAARYDIVVPSDPVILGMIRRDLLAPLRLENIPNFRNLDPQFTNQDFDPDNKYTVPYQWGTVGIFMRKQPGKVFEESWALFLDPAKQPGPFLLLDVPRACVDVAVSYKGYEANCTDPKKLAEARDLLIEAKKRSLGFASGIAGRDRVLARDAVMAVAFSNDALRGMKEDPETVYFLPREPIAKWIDNLSIPSHAPHRDLAEKFINYVLDAKVGAQLSEATCAGSPNKASLEFINPAVRSNLAIYPPFEVIRKLWNAKDLGEKQKLYDEIWTQIKSK